MSERTVNIVLDALILASAAVAMLTAIVMVSIMLSHRAVNKVDRTTHLLSVNMFISLFFGCATVFNIYCFTLYGHLHVDVSFNNRLCFINAYVFYASGCVFFYAYLLQAIYRLCRICFHTRPAFQFYKLYACGIILQWLLSFLQVVPVFLLGKFRYLPADYHCQIPIYNLADLLIGLALVHMIPVSLTTICYVYTAIYIRRSSAAVRSVFQQARNRRDFLILTRIFILLAVVIASGMPILAISLYAQFSGYLPGWATQFQWFTATFIISLVGIILIFVSPNLPKFWQREQNTGANT